MGQPQHENDLSFRTWISDTSKTLIAAQTHRDDFCTLNYSSGTTGQPKGILHTHKDYFLTAQHAGVELFGIKETDRTFSLSKLFFTYGISNSLIFPCYVGGSVVLYAGAVRLVRILETIERFQPTVMFTVPTVYISFLQVRSLIEQYDLSSLR